MKPVGKTIMERIEDTYAEAFDGIYSRILITAERGLTHEDTRGPRIEYDPLRFVAYRSTSTPSTVVGRLEAGVEKWMPGERTPDGREGVVLQYWGMFDNNKPVEGQAEKFFKEMSIRIRQDILSAAGGTTRVFDWMRGEDRAGAICHIDTEERVGRCGGGYETFSTEYGKEIITIPLMSGDDFKIDRDIGIGLGVSGANFWIMCDSPKSGRLAGNEVIRAMKCVRGVITPFYSCPSGSTTENYKPIGPPTNYRFCPTLKNKITDSKVPEGVKSIPEIVIDGVDLPTVKEAMKVGISAALEVKGVVAISAGNYEGKLGRYKIGLRDLFV